MKALTILAVLAALGLALSGCAWLYAPETVAAGEAKGADLRADRAEVAEIARRMREVDLQKVFGFEAKTEQGNKTIETFRKWEAAQTEFDVVALKVKASVVLPNLMQGTELSDMMGHEEIDEFRKGAIKFCNTSSECEKSLDEVLCTLFRKRKTAAPKLAADWVAEKKLFVAYADSIDGMLTKVQQAREAAKSGDKPKLDRLTAAVLRDGNKIDKMHRQVKAAYDRNDTQYVSAFIVQVRNEMLNDPAP